MILDFHNHVYPDHLAPRIVGSLKKSYVTCFTEGTIASLKSSMLRAGVTHAVILNIAGKPGQSQTVIDFALQTMQNSQEDGFVIIPFASVHPFEENWKELLHKVKELGFKGLKLHPNIQRFNVDDPKLEDYYNEVAKLGLILVLHAGLDNSLPEIRHASPERIYNVLPLLEQGTTIVAHMGGNAVQHRAYPLLCGRNIYFDTAFYFDKIDTELLRDIFKKHTTDKILFGSDTPCWDQTTAVCYFKEGFAPGFLSEADTRKVLFNNGAKLLGL
ncbi:amidohydrolase family protein [Desulfovibrio sp. OttesenSCG-928-F07]|nr:amidohydrolase family protein [Desulfovibrio sp. OttesenSCG-928-F07]